MNANYVKVNHCLDEKKEALEEKSALTSFETSMGRRRKKEKKLLAGPFCFVLCEKLTLDVGLHHAIDENLSF